MAATIEQWKSELATLPLAERAELAQYLLDSLETDGAAVRTEWLGLARQRMAEVRAGRVQGISAAEVLQSLTEARP